MIRNKFSPNHRIIFGVNTLNTKSGNYFNSLLIVNHNFEILYKYNKEKLVPFGEFLPFEYFLNKFGLKNHSRTWFFSKGSKQKKYIN